MMLIASFIYVLIILLLGSVLTLFLTGSRRRPLVEVLGLIFLLGAGAMPTILTWHSLFGIGPSRLTVALIALASIMVLINMRRWVAARLPLLPAKPADWREGFLGGALIVTIGLVNLIVLINTLGVPLVEWDSFAIWGLKAKVLFHSPLNPRPPFFTDVRMTYSHLDYPLLTPMLVAGGYAMIGQVEEQIGRIGLPLIFMGQTLLAYVGMRMWMNRIPALGMTLVLMGCPYIVFLAPMGIADVPLSGFLLGGIVYLLKWVQSRDTCDALICAACLSFAAQTKSEGLALMAIIMLIVAIITVMRRTWKTLGACALLIVLCVGPWLIWSMGVPHLNENYHSQLTIPNIIKNTGRLSVILPALVNHIIDIELWGVLWFMLVLMAIMGFRAIMRPEGIVLWSLIILHLGLYTVIYVVTPWNVAELINASMARLLIHLAPTVALLTAVHWGAMQEQNQEQLPG